MDKDELRAVPDEKKPDKDCNHKWERTGYWDGENMETHQPVSGPVVKCSVCDGKNTFTWEEWRELPKEVKTELGTGGED